MEPFALAVSGFPVFVKNNPWVWAIIAIGLLVLLVFAYLFLTFVQLWVQSSLTQAKVGFFDMIRMRLCKLDYTMIIRQKIALVQAGLREISIKELEAHVLAQGNLRKVVNAVIAARKARMELPWATAAAIDLAGRDVYEAVKCSVYPKVIDCPDPTKGRATLDGVCKDGVQLRARARVTVRTNLKGLIGGATEETIIARVGEGIVKAIGMAESHGDVLANPNKISEAVLDNALDSQTAFEIVSIDIAEIDVGGNIGANLQADRAQADLRVAQAHAEKRRALAVAQEQEMRANVEENRAKLIQAEAEVPRALASALHEGRMGVMDYYNLRNLQSDTQMRNAIAGSGSGSLDSNDLPGGN